MALADTLRNLFFDLDERHRDLRADLDRLTAAPPHRQAQLHGREMGRLLLGLERASVVVGRLAARAAKLARRAAAIPPAYRAWLLSSAGWECIGVGPDCDALCRLLLEHPGRGGVILPAGVHPRSVRAVAETVGRDAP
jgi:hypothetical protein